MGSEVYFTKDICRMYGLGINSIPSAIKTGIVPKPLKGSSDSGKRRWSKAVVDKHLGKTDRDQIRAIVREEIAAMREVI